MYVGSGPYDNGSKTGEFLGKFRQTIVVVGDLQETAGKKAITKKDLAGTNDKYLIAMANKFEDYDKNFDGNIDANEMRYFARREVLKF